MISFKQIELIDKPIIDNCLEGNNYRTCDLCFTNLYAWNVRFRTQYAIKNKTLFLKFVDNNEMYYSLPIGGRIPMETALAELKEDAEKCHVPFRMKGITHEMKDKIEQAVHGLFQYIPDRNNYEYLYLSEKLIHLTGKKLQSKRNHINRFKSDYPKWEYFPLTTENEREECLSMLNEWEEIHLDKTRSLRHDYIATTLMIKHFDYLQLTGAAIRANGKIVAFTMGEKLTEDTFVVHVEKAFGEINGAYAIINQQFIENEAASYKYINREEDMGLEYLRKAKLSYQPDLLLEEYTLLPNNT